MTSTVMLAAMRTLLEEASASFWTDAECYAALADAQNEIIKELISVYKMKRTQISGMVKDIPLPAIAVKATLTDNKIEKTKKETYQHTENEIKIMLEPKIEEVTKTILKDLTY